MEHTVLVELLPDHPAHGDPEAARTMLAPAHAGDAGIDLVACEEALIAPGERRIVSAGIRIALPDGVEAQVRPRSGLALKGGITVANSPGTIDPGYRGPVKVILLNTAPALVAADLRPATGKGEDLEEFRERLAGGLAERTAHVRRGDRIAQLVFSAFIRPSLALVENVSLETARGEGGFGSTGTA